MPTAPYGEVPFHAAIVALDGAVHVSNAFPAKVPGCTVLYAVAAVALVRASANSAAPRTRTRNDALIARLRCAGSRRTALACRGVWFSPMITFLGAIQPWEQTN